MMPHPERASEKAHGNLDGVSFFKGLVEPYQLLDLGTFKYSVVDFFVEFEE